MNLPITVQCQHETCPQYGTLWQIQKEDVAVSHRLIGLYDEPNLRCNGCDTEPVRILSDGSNLVSDT